MKRLCTALILAAYLVNNAVVAEARSHYRYHGRSRSSAHVTNVSPKRNQTLVARVSVAQTTAVSAPSTPYDKEQRSNAAWLEAKKKYERYKTFYYYYQYYYRQYAHSVRSPKQCRQLAVVAAARQLYATTSSSTRYIATKMVPSVVPDDIMPAQAKVERQVLPVPSESEEPSEVAAPSNATPTTATPTTATPSIATPLPESPDVADSKPALKDDAGAVAGAAVNTPIAEAKPPAIPPAKETVIPPVSSAQQEGASIGRAAEPSPSPVAVREKSRTVGSPSGTSVGVAVPAPAPVSPPIASVEPKRDDTSSIGKQVEPNKPSATMTEEPGKAGASIGTSVVETIPARVPPVALEEQKQDDASSIGKVAEANKPSATVTEEPGNAGASTGTSVGVAVPVPAPAGPAPMSLAPVSPPMASVEQKQDDASSVGKVEEANKPSVTVPGEPGNAGTSTETSVVAAIPLPVVPPVVSEPKRDDTTDAAAPTKPAIKTTEPTPVADTESTNAVTPVVPSAAMPEAETLIALAPPVVSPLPIPGTAAKTPLPPAVPAAPKSPVLAPSATPPSLTGNISKRVTGNKLLEQVAVAIKKGNYVQAKKLIEAQGSVPDGLSCTKYYYVACVQTADWQKALDSLDRLAEMEPVKKDSYACDYGRLLFELRKYDQAIKILHQAKARGVDTEPLHRTLLLIAITQHDDATAETEYRKLVSLRPADQELKIELAELLWKRNKRTESLNIFDQIAQSFPQNAEFQSKAGYAHLVQGNYKAAADRYRLAAKAIPSHQRYQDALNYAEERLKSSGSAP